MGASIESVNGVLPGPLKAEGSGFLFVLGSVIGVVHQPGFGPKAFGQAGKFVQVGVDATGGELTVVENDVRFGAVAGNHIWIVLCISRKEDMIVDFEAATEFFGYVKGRYNVEGDVFYFKMWVGEVDIEVVFEGVCFVEGVFKAPLQRVFPEGFT